MDSGQLKKQLLTIVIIISLTGLLPLIGNNINHEQFRAKNIIEPIQEISTEIQEIPDLSISDYKVNLGEEQRILWYTDYSARDDAIRELGQDKIISVFDFIPAFSTTKIDANQIPLKGLINAIDDIKSVRTATLTDQKELITELNVGVTLKKTAQIIGIDALHEIGLTGKGIKIAIVDSGVNGKLDGFINDGVSRVTEYTVKALENSTTQSPHGSHVAGIAAGNGKYNVNNKVEQFDAVGMAPLATVLSVRVLDEYGFGRTSWVAEGIVKAADLGADIISLSLSSELYNGSTDIQLAAVKYALDKGIIVVSAAGNLGPFGSGIGIPGALEEVIAVGATDLDEEDFINLWQFSAVGPRLDGYPGPDVVAPGENIISLNQEGGTLSILSGTSMATPHISGGIALIKEAFPSVTYSQIREAIVASAIDLFAPVEVQGRGLVDFTKVYEIINATVIPNNEELMMVSAPSVIKDENYMFRNPIIGNTKTFKIYIHSSRNITVIPKIDEDFNYGTRIDFSASNLELKEGLSTFEMNITITTDAIEFVSSRVYFEEVSSGKILKYANVSYFAFSAYPQARILFDVSHDRDTNPELDSNYFASHTPQGQFSLFAKRMENNGHIINQNKNQNISTELLSNIDILIISDPDKPLYDEEIIAIRDFVINQGKAMLVIVGGGLLTAEHFDYASFDSSSIDKILDGTGIALLRNSTNGVDISTTACEFDIGVFARLDTCFNKAETSQQQDVLSKLQRFPTFGPGLKLVDGTQNNAEIIALDQGIPVVMSSKLSSGGRIMVFSSALIFDNRALQFGYERNDGGEANRNAKLIDETVSWLIEPRQIVAEYSINNDPISSSVQVALHEPMKFKLKISKPNGEPLGLGDTLTISLVQLDSNDITGNQFYKFDKLSFSKIGQGIYEFDYTFSRQGVYDFYILIKDPEGKLIANDGHLEIIAELNNFNNQDNIKTLGSYMFFAIIISWILFLTNEGGRKLALKRKRDNL